METHSIPIKTHIFSIPTMGQAEVLIAPGKRGRVRFQATSWPAQLYDSNCQSTVLPDESVTVIGRKGLTLLVMPTQENRLPRLIPWWKKPQEDHAQRIA